jgi:hypothetical protein
MNIKHSKYTHIIKCERCSIPIIEIDTGTDGSFTIYHGQVTAKIICKECFDKLL